MINQVNPNKSELIKYSFYNYIGAFIGVFSNLFIYTTNQQFLGILRYIESLAYVIWPLILMGASASLINFSPKLKLEYNVKLFSYAILTILRNSFFAFCILYIGFDYFSEFFKLDYIYLPVLLALLLACIDLLKKQLTIQSIIAFPSVLDNLMPKIILPTIFIMYYYDFIDHHITGLTIYITSFFLLLLVLLFYGYRRKSFIFTTKTKSFFDVVSKKEYFNYSFFALAGSLGYLFVFKLDTLMIPNLISFKANGVYSIATVAASVIFIPARGMFSLYAPQVSKLIKNNKLTDLNVLYKDVAKTLLFLGLLIYSAIFLGIENLFQIMPAKEVLLQTVSVIFIIGLTSVFNMATGFNSEIINFSKYYKFNLIALGVLTFLNLICNYVFILHFNWGIEGAALASFLSIIIYNSFKVVFIYTRMGLLPFDYKFLKLLSVQIALISFFSFLPELSNPYLNFAYKVVGVLSAQLYIIYKSEWVVSYNSICDKFFN